MFSLARAAGPKPSNSVAFSPCSSLVRLARFVADWRMNVALHYLSQLWTWPARCQLSACRPSSLINRQGYLQVTQDLTHDPYTNECYLKSFSVKKRIKIKTFLDSHLFFKSESKYSKWFEPSICFTRAVIVTVIECEERSTRRTQRKKIPLKRFVEWWMNEWSGEKCHIGETLQS